jgi:hypothetical protein
MSNFTFEELSILRESLNVITIKGSDAIKIATLQVKVEKEMEDINKTSKKVPERGTKS